jgi:hypothetical protein
VSDVPQARSVKSTLGELRELATTGSEIAMDLWHLPEGADFASAAQAASTLYWIGEPIMFAIHPEDAAALLGRLGYRVIEVADAALLRSRYVCDQRRVYGTGYLVHASTDKHRDPRRIRSSSLGTKCEA